jgi:hypothetical protein
MLKKNPTNKQPPSGKNPTNNKPKKKKILKIF